MKRALIVLAIPAAALAIIIPLTNAGAQAPTGRTIALVEHNKGSTFGFVDNAPRNKRSKREPVTSPGDFYAFSNPVFDGANATRLGSLQATCTAATKAKISKAPVVCHGAAALNDGTLFLQAYVKGEQKVVTGAITGGTGAYVGARGTFTSTSTKTGANDVVTLLP